MILVNLLGVVHITKAITLSTVEHVFDVLVEFTLVGLHREHIVGSTIHYLLGNLLLAAHGVYGDDAA